MAKNMYSSRMQIHMMKALILVLCILCFSFLAFFLTARPAEAEKEEHLRYQYFKSIEIDQGDSLWTIAEEALADPDTAAEYKTVRAYLNDVLAINRIRDMDHIDTGSHLILPYYSTEFKG